jgi:hypothetical protein
MAFTKIPQSGMRLCRRCNLLGGFLSFLQKYPFIVAGASLIGPVLFEFSRRTLFNYISVQKALRRKTYFSIAYVPVGPSSGVFLRLS